MMRRQWQSAAPLSAPPTPPTVCVIAGDDAAPEGMRPTVEILRLLAPTIHFVEAIRRYL